MTEIRCSKCGKKLCDIDLKSDHGEFGIDIKCPRCKNQQHYTIQVNKLEDLESRE